VPYSAASEKLSATSVVLALSASPKGIGSSNLARIAAKIASAMIGDTLFPIILKLCQIVGWKT
jgi:hypothetical protein